MIKSDLLFECPANPWDQADGKGNDVGEVVLLFHLVDHPVEATLPIDRSNKDFLLATIDVRSKSLQRFSVTVDRHTEHNHVSVRNDNGRIITDLGDLAFVNFCGVTCQSTLYFAHDSFGVPIRRTSRQKIDLVSSLVEEWDQHMSAVAATNYSDSAWCVGMPHLYDYVGLLMLLFFVV